MVVVAAFLLAPTLIGFSGLPATSCYVLAGVHLVMTLITAFLFGVLKLIPFPVHGWLELVVSIALVAAPWLLKFAGDETGACWFYTCAGIVIFLVFLTTDYKAAARS